MTPGIRFGIAGSFSVIIVHSVHSKEMASKGFSGASKAVSAVSGSDCKREAVRIGTRSHVADGPGSWTGLPASVSRDREETCGDTARSGM